MHQEPFLSEYSSIDVATRKVSSRQTSTQTKTHPTSSETLLNYYLATSSRMLNFMKHQALDTQPNHES